MMCFMSSKTGDVLLPHKPIFPFMYDRVNKEAAQRLQLQK